MLDSIHEQGYDSEIDLGGIFGGKIQQISSTTFLRTGTWVAKVTSTATIGRHESAHFYVGNNHKNNTSQMICLIFVLFSS